MTPGKCLGLLQSDEGNTRGAMQKHYMPENCSISCIPAVYLKLRHVLVHLYHQRQG